MTDSNDQTQAKIVLAMDHLLKVGLGVEDDVIKEMPIDVKVRIFGDALHTAGLSILNYVPTGTEGKKNG